MAGYVIDFEPIGRRGEIADGRSILEAARQLGVDLVNLCGGAGRCGRCMVQVLEGKVSEPTAGEGEHLTPAGVGKGYRLACRAYPQTTARCAYRPNVHRAAANPGRRARGGWSHPIRLVSDLPCDVSRPRRCDDLRADAERLIEALAQEQASVASERRRRRLCAASRPGCRAWGWRSAPRCETTEVVAVGPRRPANSGLPWTWSHQDRRLPRRPRRRSDRWSPRGL